MTRPPRPLAKAVAAMVLALTTLIAPSGAWAQDKLTMNMRDADIRALIQWVADNTGRNIIVHNAVKGKVTVLSPQALTTDEAYQVFLSVLQVHGFAAVDTGEAIKIVPKNIATQGVKPSNRPVDDMVVSIVRINHVNATRLSQILRPMASKEAVMVPYEVSNSLIIADHQKNIQSLKALIKQLDRKGDRDVEVIKVNYADAGDIARSLSPLLPQQGADATSEITLSVDERSNSLLLAGDRIQRERVKHLIRQLDTPMSGEGNTQVVYLHYVDAAEVAPILKNLAEAMKKQRKDEDLVTSIEASESSNAIVINAPPAMLASMKRVIADLDIRRAQVLIESVIVEVSGDVAEDLGVSWISSDQQTISDNGVAVGVNTLGSLTVGIDPTTGNFIPGKGISFGYFDDGNIQAAIRALNASQRSNILSTPTVVAIDNEQASLLVGQNVPFITGQSTGSSSSTNDPFTTIERQDIGITLDVTPRINQGDSITLEITQKIENIVTDVQNASLTLPGASDIITNKREVVTTALIKDDQVLVLGGLISDEEELVEEKVPFLGDLPLVGKLFSGTSVSRDKKNLMIFIHPTILKDEAHVASITERRYNFMKKLQEDSEQGLKLDDTTPAVLEDFDTFSPADRGE